MKPARTPNVGDGVIVVNKPAGWTSHDVVNRMRGIAGTRRVGHLGTLDPLATGVLPLMIGQATRLARFWDRAEKSYEAVIRFGFATSTYDRDGEPAGPVTEPVVSAEQVEACLVRYRGDFLQTPPPVSAKKVAGVPAYKLARRDEAVVLQPVPVSIYELRLETCEGSHASIFIRCSAGTYVRAIAHEIGLALGCGAHVEQLSRTQSGPFRLAEARTLDELQVLKDGGRLDEALIKLPDLLPAFPAVVVDEIVEAQIRQGRDFNVSPFRVQPGTEYVKAISQGGSLIAIGQIVLPNFYHPVLVMAHSAAVACGD